MPDNGEVMVFVDHLLQKPVRIVPPPTTYNRWVLDDPEAMPRAWYELCVLNNKFLDLVDELMDCVGFDDRTWDQAVYDAYREYARAHTAYWKFCDAWGDPRDHRSEHSHVPEQPAIRGD